MASTSEKYRQQHFASQWCCEVDKFEIKKNKYKLWNTDRSVFMISYIASLLHL